MLARQIGTALAGVTARRVFRWLALRGSPPGNRALPDMRHSHPAMAENQIQDQDQQQNAADPHSAAVAISPIAETAAKQEQQNQDDQDEVHSVDLSSGSVDGARFTRCGMRLMANAVHHRAGPGAVRKHRPVHRVYDLLRLSPLSHSVKGGLPPG
jgi:hypothetical protein